MEKSTGAATAAATPAQALMLPVRKCGPVGSVPGESTPRYRTLLQGPARPHSRSGCASWPQTQTAPRAQRAAAAGGEEQGRAPGQCRGKWPQPHRHRATLLRHVPSLGPWGTSRWVGPLLRAGTPLGPGGAEERLDRLLQVLLLLSAQLNCRRVIGVRLVAVLLVPRRVWDTAREDSRRGTLPVATVT